MREASTVARRDERGVQVLVVHRPIPFTLDETARAMHAVVDPHLARLRSRSRVGRSRVRAALQKIANEGWPAGFVADPDRVEFWRQWLLDHAIFSTDSTR